MPKIDGIGQSIATRDKEIGLHAILRQHVAIVNAILRKSPWAYPEYFFFDICAGDGFNERENCDGSPIVFLKLMQRIGIKYRAFFIEINTETALKLEGRTIQFGDCHRVLCGNNVDILPKLLRDLPKNSYGMIYSDPNGYLLDKKWSNFDLLGEASNIDLAKRLDLFLRHPASATKRNQIRLSDEIQKVNKGHWFIRPPICSDRWQGVQLFATNYDSYNEWKKYRFFRLTSNEGKAAFRKLNFTKEEIINMEQPSFFLNDCRDIVWKRSCGKCEVCNKNMATEIHHLKYRSVEVPEDLIALCHRCHCIKHGVED